MTYETQVKTVNTKNMSGAKAPYFINVGNLKVYSSLNVHFHSFNSDFWGSADHKIDLNVLCFVCTNLCLSSGSPAPDSWCERWVHLDQPHRCCSEQGTKREHLLRLTCTGKIEAFSTLFKPRTKQTQKVSTQHTASVSMVSSRITAWHCLKELLGENTHTHK